MFGLKDKKLLAVGGAAAVIAAIALLRSGKCCCKKAAPASDAELVRGTWALVSGDLQGAGDLFYATLFEMEPSLRTGVFGKSDMKLQALRLMQMVDGAIKLLDQPDTLIATLLKLGERHVHYNVKAEHYPVVGKALMATLTKALGAKLTPEAAAAWGRIYGVIQETMIKGAARAQ